MTSPLPSGRGLGEGAPKPKPANEIEPIAVKTLSLFATAIVVVILAAALWLPGYLERGQNQLASAGPFSVSSSAEDFHNTLFIADLHSDTLLWHRDPLKLANRGHVDVPRLKEGNVALQVFSAVTKAPQGQNYVRNDADSDMITYLVLTQRWPRPTWTSLTERALYQAERLHKAEAAAPDKIKIVLTTKDLDEVVAARDRGEDLLGAMLATEGSHALDGELANIERLYDAGYRIMGLHHFFDNKLGGSLHGISQAGLTDFGRQAVEEMLRQGIILDLAHSSQTVAREVLAMTDKPVIVSHTGLKGACDTPRNFEDDLMKDIAAEGGLVGIGYWEGAICDISPRGVAKMIKYGVDLVGADHIALGSDYDGSTTVSFDTSELSVLTEELLKAGVSQDDIAKIMGGNILKFLRENLPNS